MSKYETVKTNKYLDAKPKSMVIEKRATNEPVQNKYFQKVISPSTPYNSMQKSAIIQKDEKGGKELPPWVKALKEFAESMVGTPEERKQILEMVSKYVPDLRTVTQYPELMSAISGKGIQGSEILAAINERNKRGDKIQDFLDTATSSATASSSPSRVVSETPSVRIKEAENLIELANNASSDTERSVLMGKIKTLLSDATEDEKIELGKILSAKYPSSSTSPIRVVSETGLASSPTTAAEIAAASSVVPRRITATPSAKRLALLDKLERNPSGVTKEEREELEKIIAAKYDPEYTARAQKIASIINPPTSLPSTASTTGLPAVFSSPSATTSSPVTIPSVARSKKDEHMELLDKLETDPFSINGEEAMELEKIWRSSTYSKDIRARAFKIKSDIDAKSGVVASTTASIPSIPEIIIDPTTKRVLLPGDTSPLPSRPKVVSETLIPDAGIVDSPIAPATDSVIRFADPTESTARIISPFSPESQARALQYLQNGRFFKTPASFKHKFEDVLENPGKDGENLFTVIDQGVVNGYITHEDALHLLRQAGMEDRRLDPRPSRVMGMINGMGAVRRKIGEGLSTAASGIKSATPKVLNAAGTGINRAGQGISWAAENVAPWVAGAAAVYGGVDVVGDYLNEQEKEKQLQDRLLSDYARQNAIPSVNENGEPILVDPKTNQEIPAVDINGNKRESFIDNPMRQSIVNSKMKDNALQYQEKAYADPFTGQVDPNYKIYRENVYDPSVTRLKQEIGRFGAGQASPTKQKPIWDENKEQWKGRFDDQSKNLRRISRLSGDIWENPANTTKRMKKGLQKAGEVKDITSSNFLNQTTAPRFSINQNLLNSFKQFGVQAPNVIQNPMLNNLISGAASGVKSSVGANLFEAAFNNPEQTEKSMMDRLTELSNAILNSFSSSALQKQAVLKTVTDVGGKINTNGKAGDAVSVQFPAAIGAKALYTKMSNMFSQEEIAQKARKQEADIAKAPEYLQERLKRSVNLDNTINRIKFDREQQEIARGMSVGLQRYEHDRPKTTDANFNPANIANPLRGGSGAFFRPSSDQVYFGLSSDRIGREDRRKAIDMVNGKYKPKSKIEELQLIGTAQTLENKRKQALAQASAARAKAAAKAKADAEAAAKRNKIKNDTLTAYQMMGMNVSKPILPTMATTSSKNTTAITSPLTPPLTPSALAIQSSAPVIPIAPIMQASPYQEQAMAIAEAQRQQAVNSQIMQLIANRKI